ncbi:MAG TPA: hypothetical protein VFA80_15035 [Xanthobacteraceae bacterium]|nr:hypothetical protein [Xanthobacteraceae bacterium]
MRPRDPIADFGGAVARELSFDPRLARRLRAEVEDHLHAEVADRADPDGENRLAEAMCAFGDPKAFARQFLATALLSLARRAAAVTAAAVVGMFGAMEARVVWYGWVNWPVSDHVRAANAIGHPLDRFAFVLAAAFALSVLAYVITRRTPARFHATFGWEIDFCVKLNAAVALALMSAMVTELVLTGVRLFEAELDGRALVPFVSLMLEVAVAGGSMSYILIMMNRCSRALRLAA